MGYVIFRPSDVYTFGAEKVHSAFPEVDVLGQMLPINRESLMWINTPVIDRTCCIPVLSTGIVQQALNTGHEVLFVRTMAKRTPYDGTFLAPLIGEENIFVGTEENSMAGWNGVFRRFSIEPPYVETSNLVTAIYVYMKELEERGFKNYKNFRRYIRPFFWTRNVKGRFLKTTCTGENPLENPIDWYLLSGHLIGVRASNSDKDYIIDMESLDFPNSLLSDEELQAKAVVVEFGLRTFS